MTNGVALSDEPSLGRLVARALVARALVARATGDHATAVTTMEEAQRVFDQVGSADQISDFAVPEWRMNTFVSMLWLAESGDKTSGLAYAQTALDRLPPERHSLSLRLLTDEIQRPRRPIPR